VPTRHPHPPIHTHNTHTIYGFALLVTIILSWDLFPGLLPSNHRLQCTVHLTCRVITRESHQAHRKWSKQYFLFIAICYEVYPKAVESLFLQPRLPERRVHFESFAEHTHCNRSSSNRNYRCIITRSLRDSSLRYHNLHCNAKCLSLPCSHILAHVTSRPTSIDLPLLTYDVNIHRTMVDTRTSVKHGKILGEAQRGFAFVLVLIIQASLTVILIQNASLSFAHSLDAMTVNIDLLLF